MNINICKNCEKNSLIELCYEDNKFSIYLSCLNTFYYFNISKKHINLFKKLFKYHEFIERSIYFDINDKKLKNIINNIRKNEKIKIETIIQSFISKIDNNKCFLYPEHFIQELNKNEYRNM